MRADLVRARLEAGEVAKLGLTLVYGLPGSGKTFFTTKGIASLLIDRCYFFSLDRGYETILFAKEEDGTPVLSQEELAKVHLITTQEGETTAHAGPLIRHLFKNPNWKGWITAEGKRAPSGKEEDGATEWPGLSALDERSLIIIDPLTILGHSIHKSNELSGKFITKSGAPDTQRIYGEDQIQMSGLLSSMQGHKCHIVCLAHALLPDVQQDRHFDMVYPEFGSKNFSVKCSSYFGNVIYLHVTNKFNAGSHPLYKPKIIARSRQGIRLEKLSNPTLADLIQRRDQKE